MMGQSIFAALSEHAGLSGLVSNRIYPLRMPQNSTFPAVTYTRISGDRISNLDGGNIANPRYQIDCWAETYAGVKAVAAQVELAMGTLTAVLIADRDDKDDDIELYRISLDFSVWA